MSNRVCHATHIHVRGLTGALSNIFGRSSRRYAHVQMRSNSTVMSDEKSKIADILALTMSVNSSSSAMGRPTQI
jgi:hypothetical protein